MAKTGGSLRGGSNKALSKRLTNHLQGLSLSEISATEKEYNKIKNEQYESNDTRFDRLKNRIGEAEAKQQLTDGVNRIMDKNDTAEQYHKNRIKEAKEAIKKTNSTKREIAWAKRDLKESKESLMKTRADLEWFKDFIL